MTKILHIPSGEYLYYPSNNGIYTQDIEKVIEHFSPAYDSVEKLYEYTVAYGKLKENSLWHTHNRLPLNYIILRSELEIIYE